MVRGTCSLRDNGVGLDVCAYTSSGSPVFSAVPRTRRRGRPSERRPRRSIPQVVRRFLHLNQQVFFSRHKIKMGKVLNVIYGCVLPVSRFSALPRRGVKTGCLSHLRNTCLKPISIKSLVFPFQVRQSQRHTHPPLTWDTSSHLTRTRMERADLFQLAW